MREVQGKLQLGEFNIIPYDNSNEPPWKLPTDLICPEEIVKTKKSV